jgi:signal peptidase I
MTKKRNPSVAVLFSIVSPGLGFLYVGKPMLAVGFPLAGILALAVISWTRLIFDPSVVLALMGVAIVVWLGAIAASGIIAHRQGEVTLSKSQRWYVYIAFIIVTSITESVLEDNRGQWFGYEPYRFPSQSMASTLLHSDFILADTWKYRTDSPKRGDIVVFRLPAEPSVYYAKRVIGVPGDSVLIMGGFVYVNGEQLVEPYVAPENNQKTSKRDATFQVGSNAYFVLGDNRDNSNDSRYWGFVPAENVAGSVEYIWFSWDSKMGLRTDRIGKAMS